MATQVKKRTSYSSHAVTTSNLVAAASAAAFAGAAYFFRRELMALVGHRQIYMAPHIRQNLPIAKELLTISDFDGNYDLDGVSFDSEGVVVGSDQQTHAQKQIH